MACHQQSFTSLSTTTPQTPKWISHILPYFEAVTQSLGTGYRVGIYTPRNICNRVSRDGYEAS
ncbi:glycoside hydrolase domain-containing protein [Cutibacterium avidum]|uniref:glycoside hydrolase domain-containing protein n=1 Tax=Cutibacterium avidum TaxID=33010 RepID=UPI003305882E